MNVLYGFMGKSWEYMGIPSGNLFHSYWRLPFIVNLPIEDGGSFLFVIGQFTRPVDSMPLVMCFWGELIADLLTCPVNFLIPLFKVVARDPHA